MYIVGKGGKKEEEVGKGAEYEYSRSRNTYKEEGTSKGE
jgi:hypothetical protein